MDTAVRTMPGDDEPTPLPAPAEWGRHGWTILGEIQGGFQSRVYRCRSADEDLVVKLTDRRFVDNAYLARLELLVSLGAFDSSVVAPRRADDGIVATEIGGWCAVVYPLVRGRRLDPTVRDDVTAMAATLVDLHRSMRDLDRTTSVPLVAALRTATVAADGFGPDQLLHGDYSSSNLMQTQHGVRVLDFDDAGYGPVEFEIGNTLYIVLFDATLNRRLDEYRRFRQWFIEKYDDDADSSPRIDLVDDAVTLRKAALSNWIEDLPNAPIGIRSASPEWLRELRRFVTSG